MNEFFREYLDAPTDRFGTDCIKWDHVDKIFGGEGLYPAWVADMDFRTVPEVREALVERAGHAIYGYTDTSDGDKAAEIGWLKRRYGFECDPEWILYSPGVVDSLYFCVRALTEPNDKIVISTPVYGPFFSAVKDNGRTLCESPMRYENGRCALDLDNIESFFRGGAKMYILCNPHNPVGRVWAREELQQLVDLANRYGVIVISDEIHSDFTLDGREHTRILSLKDSDNCVMLTSATKSFNLAGLRQSSAIIRDKALREKVSAQINVCHASSPNIFGAAAQRAAYTYGDKWMDSVVEYIQENRDYAVDRLRAELPMIGVYPQEATYLMWLDFTALGMTDDEIKQLLVKNARVALNEGTFFGELGKGHVRLNVGTQCRNVEEVLNRIIKAVKEL